MDELKTFLRGLKSEAEKEAFASRCGTTWNYMRMVAYSAKAASPELAIAIDMNSGGVVPAETVCPKHAEKFAYLRQSASRGEASGPRQFELPYTGPERRLGVEPGQILPKRRSTNGDADGLGV